ncbi:exodeoxyribonuclease III [Sphingomonas mesophila]|uniref:exodeoxyribonuclease III n=1 Tax=Sphingomonas mesophila TaxID=2303576 RepID=UPI000E57E210|nr:exodeoxyribonuclease III [Sphingomonas mesophila]
MRIASYNINGITSRLPVLLRWLEEAQPDVVCLQELKTPSERFPRAEIEKAGYSAIWHGQQRWNGVAMLSRVGEPVEIRRALPNDPDLAQSRYLEAAVSGVLIAGFYAPNGNPWPGPKFGYKLAWLTELRRHGASLFKAKAPVVMIGDYNIIPTERDAYKAERWVKDALFAPEARALYAELLADGWTDALDTYFKGDPPFTFWHYWRNSFARDAGIRIDHALLNKVAARRLVAAGVDREPRGWDGTSDHAPVWVELKV